MTISFNTIPSNTLVPIFYAEMDNSAANTAQDSGASLLIGHANNGAEIVANSLVLMPSADYARQICGAGSQLARMVEAYRQTDPFGELYVIAVPESTGAAATVTLTVTGAATETGTVNVYVGRTRVQAPVTNGDNVATIASSIKDAINAVPTLPFTASSSAGVVTLTARHKGLCGNEIPVSLNYYGFGGGEVLPAGVQIAVATGIAGTGAPVLTGAVAAMADEPFDYIGLPFNDTASVNTLVNGLPSSGVADTLTGGFDTEDLETWRARVIERYYWTPQGGADGDYVVWAKEVPGITRAWTYRHWMGTGTVGVMIASSDLINPIPEESTETAARQHIGPLAPVAGSDLYVFRPVAHTVDFHIRVTPDTPEIRAAITAELRSFLLRDGYPQGELKVSRISEAISGANGEYSHQLLTPADNISIAKNELAVLGTISWT